MKAMVHLAVAAALAAGCSAERRQLTETDAYNPDAPVAEAQASTALTTTQEPSPVEEHRPQHHGHSMPTVVDAGTAAVYVCPMHPEVETTDPKLRCPKCHMKLVPKS